MSLPRGRATLIGKCISGCVLERLAYTGCMAGANLQEEYEAASFQISDFVNCKSP